MDLSTLFYKATDVVKGALFGVLAAGGAGAVGTGPDTIDIRIAEFDGLRPPVGFSLGTVGAVLGKITPYVVISLQGPGHDPAAVLLKTSIYPDAGATGSFNWSGRVRADARVDSLVITVRDRGPSSVASAVEFAAKHVDALKPLGQDTVIGAITIPLNQLLGGYPLENWFNLYPSPTTEASQQGYAGSNTGFPSSFLSGGAATGRVHVMVSAAALAPGQRASMPGGLAFMHGQPSSLQQPGQAPYQGYQGGQQSQGNPFGYNATQAQAQFPSGQAMRGSGGSSSGINPYAGGALMPTQQQQPGQAGMYLGSQQQPQQQAGAGAYPSMYPNPFQPVQRQQQQQPTTMMMMNPGAAQGQGHGQQQVAAGAAAQTMMYPSFGGGAAAGISNGDGTGPFGVIGGAGGIGQAQWTTRQGNRGGGSGWFGY